MNCLRRAAMSNINNLNHLDLLLFGIYPYVAMSICLLGSWARFDLSQYTWKAGSSQMLSNKGMRVASNLFHVGVLFVLAGHFVGLLTPASVYHHVISTEHKQLLAMVSGGFFGMLCLIGLLMLIKRRLTDARVRATSSHSDIMILLVLLGAAGTFAFVDFTRWIVLATSENRRVRWSLVTVGTLGALAFTQNIPQVLTGEIAVAYSDTDGDGERADQRPPGAASYFEDVDETITSQLGRDRADIVILTADTTFLAYYPYYGFQSLTSHYANPLADFSARAAAIEDWSELGTPDELLAAWDDAPWRAPDAVVFRQSAEGYTLRLAEDVYPNDPNVRRYTVTFPKALFDDPRFTVTEVGPFVVVTRAAAA